MRDDPGHHAARRVCTFMHRSSILWIRHSFHVRVIPTSNGPDVRFVPDASRRARPRAAANAAALQSTSVVIGCQPKPVCPTPRNGTNRPSPPLACRHSPARRYCLPRRRPESTDTAVTRRHPWQNANLSAGGGQTSPFRIIGRKGLSCSLSVQVSLAPSINPGEGRQRTLYTARKTARRGTAGDAHRPGLAKP